MKISMKIACFRIATDLPLAARRFGCWLPQLRFCNSQRLSVRRSVVRGGIKRYCLFKAGNRFFKKIVSSQDFAELEIVAGPA